MAKGNEPMFGTMSTKGVEMQESSQVVPDEKLGIGNRGKGKKVILACVAVTAILAIAAMVVEERKPERPPLDLSIAPAPAPASSSVQGVVQTPEAAAPAVTLPGPDKNADSANASAQVTQPVPPQPIMPTAQTPSVPAPASQIQPTSTVANQEVVAKVPVTNGVAMPSPSPVTIPAAPASQQTGSSKADPVLVSGMAPVEAKQGAGAPAKAAIDQVATPKIKKAVTKKPQASETKREPQVPAVQEEGVTREEIIILSGEK